MFDGATAIYSKHRCPAVASRGRSTMTPSTATPSLANGWNADTAAGPLGSTVTLVEGSNFCISSANGDILPEYPHGVFYEDMRIPPLESEGERAIAEAPGGRNEGALPGAFRRSRPTHGRARGQPADCERLREVGIGILEQITMRNHSGQSVECVVALVVESDFADLFEVKEARVQRRWAETPRIGRPIFVGELHSAS